MSTASAALFRKVVGNFTTGITVISTVQRDSSGELTADFLMTANSFTSVSLEPEIVSISVGHQAHLLEPLVHSRVWGVSILGLQGQDDAREFAHRPAAHTLLEDPARFIRGEHTGVLLLRNALATLEVRTCSQHTAGDHDVIFGEVCAKAILDEQSPALVYFRSRYGSVEINT